jgi:tight adherence protein B
MLTHPARRPRPLAVAAAFASVLLLLGLSVGWTATAGAAGGDALQIREVDTVDPAAATVQFLYTGDPDDVDDALLSDNGNQVDTAAPQVFGDTERIAVNLVFDTSSAMDDSGALVSAKEAAIAWIDGRTDAQKANQLIGVYAAAGEPIQVLSPTSDTARILSAIEQVAPPSDVEQNDQSALWDTMTLAAGALAEHDGHQANLIVMTASGNTVSGSRSAANGAVANAGASVFAVELLGQGLSPGSLDDIVRDNGGLVYTTETGTDLGSLVGEAAVTIDDKQFTMGFEPTTETGSVANLDLTVVDQSATAAVVVGSQVVGAASLNPEVKTSSGGVSFLQGPLGLVIMIAVVVLAGVALAYGVIMIFVREDRLATVLQPYDDALAVHPDDVADDGGGSNALARTAFVQRAVQITEQVAEQRGFLSRTEASLERANLPLRAGEALFFYAAIVVVATLLSLVVTGSVILGLVVGLFAALVPIAAVTFLAGRRRRAFMALLPDTLSLLAGTLRAGYSLMQGVEAVSQEVSEPMGLELRRVVTEARLGRPLEEALDGVALRMASPDFAWAVMAIRIQREVGGNLSELLLTVAETMIQRERLRRDVAALTAEGRMSAYILIALPVGLGAVMFAMNREYTSKLIDTTVGNVLLGLAVVSAGIGYLWMRKIINIRI